MPDTNDDLIVTWLSETDIMFEHADLKGGPYMNFEGKEKQYNRAGERNFCLVLPEELAHEMVGKEWSSISFPKERPEDQDKDPEDRYPRTPHAEVKVEFGKGRPPKIVLITSAGKTELDQNTVAMLDVADMANVDLIIHGYRWNADGRSGLKPYLKTMYVTLNEDALERKYAMYDGLDEED